MTATIIQDSRGFFMVPQAPEESGYYTYGSPSNGAGQFANPKLMSLLFLVENQWASTEPRQFGIGNISLAGGVKFKGHATHRSGLELDVRPLRKDGKHLPVTRHDKEYDQDATRKLIGLFLQSGMVDRILFNDRAISKVIPMAHHDDHFHVKAKM
jgi:penicillin-insensitive murein DD-endopeptidase